MPELAAVADSPGTILVVDDDHLFLRVCTAVLQHAGYAVESVDDPTDVTATLRAGHFDAVVSDVRMPNIDGVQLLKAIRSFDRDMPVVLMTGQPTIEAAIKAIEFKALRMLQKPFEVDELINVVNEAVRSRASNAPTLLHQKLDRSLSTLHMAYQPIVKTVEGRTVAWEALVRCTDGAKNAGELIGLAESTARLRELGRKIRNTVGRDAAQLPPDALLFVNAHPEDLSDPHLVAPDAPLSRIADRVVIEITERAGLDHVDHVADVIAHLRALGFRIAVDDLGAGYSGLTTFASIEPDFVKLDRALVSGLDLSAKQRAVVASMLRLAQDVGCEVIAEGIETGEERQALDTLGVQWMQGYLFGRPGAPFLPGLVVPRVT